MSRFPNIQRPNQSQQPPQDQPPQDQSTPPEGTTDDDYQYDSAGTPDDQSEASDGFSFDGAEVLQGLISDPDIQAVLAAKRSGQPFQIAPVQQEASDVEESDPFEGLDDVDDDLKRLVEALDKRFSGKLTSLTDKIGALEQVAKTYEARNVSQQISQTAKKHQDFAQYRKVMAELSRQNPDLGVEDLYILAKHRAGKLQVAEPSTHSEKPTASPRSRAGRGRPGEKSGNKPTRGRRAFEVTLADALDNLGDITSVE